MKLLVLFGQRKCNYPSQYAVEVIAATDEYSNDDNPDYIQDALAAAQTNDEFDAVNILSINVDDNEVHKRLYPAEEPIEGEVED